MKLLQNRTNSALLGLALDRLALHLLSGIPGLVRHLLARSTNGTVLLECLAYGAALLGGESSSDYERTHPESAV